MFNDQRSKYTVLVTLILLELLTFGDKTVLGRHLHRHEHRTHNLVFPHVVLGVDEFYDSNNKIEDSKNIEDHPHPQPQPEDFIFLTDSFPDPNLRENFVNKNEKMTEVRGNELLLFPAEYGEKKRKEDEAKISEEKSFYDPMKFPDRPPVIEGRNIIVAPPKECPNGQKQDSKGKCKVVLK